MDYSQYPPSVTELRGDKTNDPNDSTPRDTLIYLLREIDAGRLNVEHILISVKLRTENRNDCHTMYVNGGELEPLAQLGLLSAVRALVERDL